MLDSWLESTYNSFINGYKNNLPNSIIIDNALSRGSFNLAREIIQYYLCTNKHQGHACNECHSCKLFLTESHPDFLHLKASLGKSKLSNLDNKNAAPNQDCSYINDFENYYDQALNGMLRIDEIRKIDDFIIKNPIFCSYKVVLISNSQRMNANAANCILKIFEEPPVNTLILMLTNSFDELLATLLSRACKISVNSVKLEHSLEFFKGLQIDIPRAKLALSLAQYEPYLAKFFIQKNLDVTALELISAMVQSLYDKDANKDQLFDLIKKIDISETCLILRCLILQLIKYKAYCKRDDLTLLENLNLDILSKIQTQNLLLCYEKLSNIAKSHTLLQPRAPNSIILDMLDILRIEN